MGLHSGEPVRHEDGYAGLDVHRAARIAAVAHCGQVVLSEATRQLAGSRLPAGASLLDLGLHRLKDIETPEHIYQLVAAGLPERFPPLKSTLAEAAAPAAVGAAPIVGRVAEREALLAAYARVVAGRPQVLLITGAAGIGKTRLVEELCALAESAAGGARVLLGESAPLPGAALAYGPFVAALCICARSRVLAAVAAAEHYFRLVWTVDHGYIGAVFGLARTRLAAGDPAAAIAALTAVPTPPATTWRRR